METPTEFGAVFGVTVNKDAPGTFSCSEALVVATEKLVTQELGLLQAPLAARGSQLAGTP